MAVVMSRYPMSNGAPPLPSRNPPQRHKSERSQSVDHSVIHVKMTQRQSSEPRQNHRPLPEEPSGGRRHDGAGIRRQNFTQSFIERNTARVISNPDSYAAGNRRRVDKVVYPTDENTPAPPPISSLPRKVSAASDRKTRPAVEQPQNNHHRKPEPGFDPPSLPPKSPAANPPSRPPKTLPVEPVPSRPPKPGHVQSPEPPAKQINSPQDDIPPTRPAKAQQSLTTGYPAPERPPKVIRSPSTAPAENPAMYDLEKRFFFHSENDFPDPEPMSNVRKTRADMTKSFIKLDQKERIGHL